MPIGVLTFIRTPRRALHVLLATLVVISGLSTASPASARTWPPLAPSSLTLTPGDGQLTADWTESSTNGNSPIDHYTLYVYPEADEDSETSVDVPASTLTYTATGLTNGTSFCVAIETYNWDFYRSTTLTRSCATPVESAPTPTPTPEPSDTASPSASPSDTATPSPSASSLTAQGITYYVDGDGKAVVTGCDGACPSSLSIPFMVTQGILVTSIASYAFANQTLSAVTIPWSVVAIGDHAFEGNALTTLTIQGAPSIGYAAFKDNILTSVTMSSNAPVDGGDAFANNTDLTAIDVKHGTTGWGSTWGGISVRVGPAFTYTLDGDGNATLTGAIGTPDSPFVVPDSIEGHPVTGISDWAFSGLALTSPTLPNTLKSIGSAAFMYSSVSALTIPSSVTYIGSSAFANTALTSVVFEGDAPSIGSGPLFESSPLTAVDVPYGATGWSESFSGVTVRVAVPFTYTTDSDNNVTITGCLNSCPSDVVIPSSIEGHPVTQIGEEAFMEKGINSVSLPDSLTAIGVAAFSGNSLSSLVIPASVTTLGSGAFRNNLLTSLVIPESVNDLGWYTFVNNRLVSLTFEGNMPNGGQAALTGNGNNQLKSVTVAYGTTGWGSTYYGKTVVIASPFTYETDGDNNASITGCKKSCPSEMVIPSAIDGHSVTQIGDAAFQGKGLTSVTFPDSLVSIGNWAFENNSLTSVTLPASLTTLGTGTFYINAFTSVTVPSSVTTIGALTFAKNSLTSVTFEGNAPSEGNNVFENNPELTGITVTYGATGWASTFAGIPVNVVGEPTPPPAPVGKPASAPKIRTVKSGNAKVRLGIWSPLRNGGTEITGYEYTVDDGATWTAVDSDSTATTLLITGLENGTRYTIKVRAVNGAGGGAASNARAFTPRTVASAPTITAVTGGSGRIKVEFEAPVSNGGAAITRYGYSINGRPVQNFGSASTTQWIKNLPNNVTYTVQVVALNAAGWGAASEVLEATPHR
jgi:hypothetical protein